MAQDKNAQMRNLIAGYRDSMMLSDIKALIAVLFVAIMMGTVLQYRQNYPWYLSPLVILSPFLIIYLNLLMSVYPRFPRAGRGRFPIWRNADPKAFDFIADTEAELEGLPALCAGLSRILWWKNVTLLTANILSIACLAAAIILLFVSWIFQVTRGAGMLAQLKGTRRNSRVVLPIAELTSRFKECLMFNDDGWRRHGAGEL